VRQPSNPSANSAPLHEFLIAMRKRPIAWVNCDATPVAGSMLV
jgi:hypothetical protein